MFWSWKYLLGENSVFFLSLTGRINLLLILFWKYWCELLSMGSDDNPREIASRSRSRSIEQQGDIVQQQRDILQRQNEMQAYFSSYMAQVNLCLSTCLWSESPMRQRFLRPAHITNRREEKEAQFWVLPTTSCYFGFYLTPCHLVPCFERFSQPFRIFACPTTYNCAKLLTIVFSLFPGEVWIGSGLQMEDTAGLKGEEYPLIPSTDISNPSQMGPHL